MSKIKLHESLKIIDASWRFKWRGYQINFNRIGNDNPYKFSEDWFDLYGSGGRRSFTYKTESSKMSKDSFLRRILETADLFSNDPNDQFWRRCNESPGVIRKRQDLEERIRTNKQWTESLNLKND